MNLVNFNLTVTAKEYASGNELVRTSPLQLDTIPNRFITPGLSIPLSESKFVDGMPETYLPEITTRTTLKGDVTVMIDHYFLCTDKETMYFKHNYHLRYIKGRKLTYKTIDKTPILVASNVKHLVHVTTKFKTKELVGTDIVTKQQEYELISVDSIIYSR